MPVERGVAPEVTLRLLGAVVALSAAAGAYSISQWRHREHENSLGAKPTSKDPQSARTHRIPGCAQAYTGTDCTTPRQMACYGLGFPDRDSITLNQVGNAKALARIRFNGTQAQEQAPSSDWEPSEMNHPPIVDKNLSDALPPLPFIGRRKHAFKSCALVGNSPSLKKSGWGRDIDNHDIVTRCNNAPTKGFKKFVGSWTSFRYSNERWSGVTEGGEPGIGRYCSTERNFGQLPCGNTAEFQASLRSEFRQFMNAMDKKYHVLNPAFDKWIEDAFRPSKAYPSTGLRALGLLLHLCESIDVYGFGGTESFRQWYWSKYKGYDGKPPGQIMQKYFPKLSKMAWHVDDWSYGGEYEYEAFAGKIKKKHLPGTRPPFHLQHQPAPADEHEHDNLRPLDYDDPRATHKIRMYRRRLLDKTGRTGRTRSQHDRSIEEECLASMHNEGTITLKREAMTGDNESI